MRSFVLVLTDSTVIAYQTSWRRKISVMGDTGLDGDLPGFLERLVSKHHCFCCRLIIDRSDEEYVLDEQSSIQSARAKQLIALKSARHFSRESLTTGMLVVGSDGKPRGRMVCAGIELKHSMLRFLECLEQSRIVIKRIDSLALLLANHCGGKSLRQKTLLVLSSQDSEHWRFSLIQSSKLLMSRCVLVTGRNKWRDLVDELKRTQAYAGSLIEERDAVQVLYAGPSIKANRTPDERLIHSIGRRYSLYNSERLYESVITRSRTLFRQPPPYVWKQHQSAYSKYLVLNAALLFGCILFFGVSINAYLSVQEINRFAAQKQALEYGFSSVEEQGVTALVTDELNKLSLNDLEQLLSFSLVPDSFTESRELQYRLAMVLSEFSLVELLGITFSRAPQLEVSGRPYEGDVGSIRITARFSPRHRDVTEKDINEFLSSFVEAGLNILGQTGFDVSMDKKGQLVTVQSRVEPVVEELSVVVELDQKTGV